MQGKGWMRVAAFALLAAMTVFAVPPAMAAAMPSQMTAESASSAPPGQMSPENVATERALVKAKLMDFGLTSAQAQSRVDLLTDQEVHALAADLDSIKPGAAHTFTDVEILLLLILVAILAD